MQCRNCGTGLLVSNQKSSPLYSVYIFQIRILVCWYFLDGLRGGVGCKVTIPKREATTWLMQIMQRLYLMEYTLASNSRGHNGNIGTMRASCFLRPHALNSSGTRIYIARCAADLTLCPETAPLCSKRVSYFVVQHMPGMAR